MQRYEETFAGELATQLSACSSRGVSVDFKTAAVLPAHAAIRYIGLVGAHTYRVAVFAPCYLENSFRPAAEIRRYVEEICEHLLDTGGPNTHVVLLGIPAPSQTSRLDRAAAIAAGRANMTLRRLDTRGERVTYVQPPLFQSVHDKAPFDAEYYADLGRSMADALLPELGYLPDRQGV